MILSKVRVLALLPVACFAVAIGAGQSAVAQYGYYNSPSSNYTSPSSVYLDNTIRRPTVSPYLNLLLPGGQLGTNYQTMVLPQLEQERANREQATRINQLQNQFNQAVSGSRAPRQRQEGMRPTGHAAGFMNYGHYYRMPQPQR